jgi:hypothetical protein
MLVIKIYRTVELDIILFPFCAKYLRYVLRLLDFMIRGKESVREVLHPYPGRQLKRNVQRVI